MRVDATRICLCIVDLAKVSLHVLDPARFAPYLAVHLLPLFAHPTDSAAFWCDGAEGCVEIEVACKGGGG